MYLLLMDITDTDLLLRGKNFTVNEGRRTHTFEWLEFDRLKDEYFYPLFLKKDIYNLPDIFTIRTEIEWADPIWQIEWTEPRQIKKSVGVTYFVCSGTYFYP